MKKKGNFDPLEARYMITWMRRCNAMEVGERGGGCRYCPEVNNQCSAGLMERAAKQLEEAVKILGDR